MSKIISTTGKILSNTNTPKIVGVQATGSQVLVEMLTSQELMGTTLALSESTDLKVPLQGYIRSVGPGFLSDSWGYKIGDRVIVSGGGVMAPNYDGSHRDRFFMEPSSIKGVLSEG